MVRARRVHTEKKLAEMGIELPVPKPPLGATQKLLRTDLVRVCVYHSLFRRKGARV